MIKQMNSENFSLNSRFDLRNNLLSNHFDDTWLTIVIIVFLIGLLSLLIIGINCNFILKLLQYCNFI